MSWKAAGTPAPARLLDRARQEPLDEVALETQEHHERDGQRHERRGRDQLDVRSELAQLREDGHRYRLRVARERQRDDQVVPRPQELEDRERRDRRQAERQHQLEEDPELRRAVDARRLEYVLGYAYEEVAQQEDPERQPERDMEQNEAEDRVEQAGAVVEREDRDQRHLQRHDQ